MKRMLLTMAALFAALSVHAGSADGEVLPFLRIDRNPVTASMAGAGLSATTGADCSYAVFGNVASVSLMEKCFSASASYSRWMPSVSGDHRAQGGFAVRAGQIVGLTGGFAWGGQQSVEVNGAAFRPYDLVAGVGISLAVASRFSLGIAGKYVRQQVLSDYSMSAFSADLSAQYHGKQFNVMAGLIGLGPKVQGEDDRYSLPASVKLGGDYVFNWAPVSLLLALDADYYFSRNYSVAAGLQVGVKDWVYVRGGYRYASRDCVIPSHMALGIGGGYAGVSLHFSWLLLNKELGNTFLVGIGYSF